eukprot:1825260-Alexandrium_andersonii.AAC.1
MPASGGSSPPRGYGFAGGSASSSAPLSPSFLSVACARLAGLRWQRGASAASARWIVGVPVLSSGVGSGAHGR